MIIWGDFEARLPGLSVGCRHSNRKNANTLKRPLCKEWDFIQEQNMIEPINEDSVEHAVHSMCYSH